MNISSSSRTSARSTVAILVAVLALLVSTTSARAGEYYEKAGAAIAGYLNYNDAIQKKWRGDIPGYVAKADKNWPEVSRQTKVAQ